MRIIITGSLGHIGSFLIRDFANSYTKYRILMIDNMMTQRFSSLFNLPEGTEYSFIDQDILNLDLENILTSEDIVIHLAAITDAAGSFDKADEVEKNNYSTTEKIAKACLLKKARLITLSSTSVYGTQNQVVAENCTEDELKPQSPYATTKLKEEKLITDLCVNEGLRAVIFRFGTIFGISTGMRFHTAVNKFCWQAVMKQPITVWKTAFNQKRPYLDIKDASNAFKHIINHDIFDGEIYNVLTLNTTVKDIVDLIQNEIPGLEINFVDNKIMNQLSYEVSSEKFMKTGFSYCGNLKLAIKETVNLLKQTNNFND